MTTEYKYGSTAQKSCMLNNETMAIIYHVYCAVPAFYGSSLVTEGKPWQQSLLREVLRLNYTFRATEPLQYLLSLGVV
jgi:hypothetical protein